MKKWIAALVAATMLLAGCGASPDAVSLDRAVEEAEVAPVVATPSKHLSLIHI